MTRIIRKYFKAGEFARKSSNKSSKNQPGRRRALIMNKAKTWDIILKAIIAVASAILGAIGGQAVM